MATLATTKLLTLEEFLALPGPADGTRYELHEGELVSLTYPKWGHTTLQQGIAELLKQLLGKSWFVCAEMPFQPASASLRSADVGVITVERHRATAPNSYLQGSPDLVIEIASPSNSVTDLERKEALCLATGCREFWVVYPELQTIRVTDGQTIHRYGLTDSLTSVLLSGTPIPVASLLTPEQP